MTTHGQKDARVEAGRSRRSHGLDLLRRVQGDEGARDIVESFDRLHPDFGHYVLEAGFADVYGRPGLDLPTRQLLNVAVLTALGGAEGPLRTHLRGALNVGVRPEQLLETLFHVALYAGHPRSVTALPILAEVFAERGLDPAAYARAEELADGSDHGSED